MNPPITGIAARTLTAVADVVSTGFEAKEV
jgi:hypothetical protein